MVNNVSDATIAVMIRRNPPSDPFRLVSYYRVKFQLISDGGCGDVPSDSVVMSNFANATRTGTIVITIGTTPTMTTLVGLGQ